MRSGYDFLVHRLVSIALAILVILTVEFVVFEVLQGPMLVPKTGDILVRERTMEDWATNEPRVVQYFVFMKRMLTGDFGTSTGVWHGSKISLGIYDYAVRTAALFSFSTIIAIALGALASSLVSKAKSDWPARAAAFIELLLLSLSAFLIAVVVVRQVALRYDPGLPIWGTRSPDYHDMDLLEKTWDFARHATLPVISVILSCFGGFALVAREGFLRTKGMSAGLAPGIPPQDVRKSRFGSHASDALFAFAPHSKLLIVWAISCTLVTEFFFGWDGLGMLLGRALFARDFVVFQALFFMVALLAILAILAWDIVTFLIQRVESEPISDVGAPEQVRAASSSGDLAILLSIWKEYKRSTSGLIALIAFLALGVVALLGPLVVKLDFSSPAEGPDPTSYFVQGGAEHFITVVISVVLSVALGAILGAVAMRGRLLDRIIMLFADAFLVLPLLPLGVAVGVTNFYFNPNVFQIALLLSIVLWAPVAMVVRERARSSRGASRAIYLSKEAVWLNLRDALSAGKYLAVISTAMLTFLEILVIYYPGSWGAALLWEYENMGFDNLSLDWVLPAFGIVLLGMSLYKVLEHLEKALTEVFETE